MSAAGGRRIPWGRVIVSAAVAALAVLLARSMDLGRLWAVLRDADWRLVAAAGLTNATFNTLARVGRWKALLGPLPRTTAGVRFGELVWVYFAAQAASNLLPARAGEALRVVQLQRRHGYPAVGLVTVQLVEVLVGAVTLGLFTLPMVPLGKAPAALAAPIVVFAAAGPVGMAALFAVARFAPAMAVPAEGDPAAVASGQGRVARVAVLVRGLVARLVEAVRLLGSLPVWARALGWSLLSDLSDVAMIGLVLAAVGVSLPPASWVLIYAGVNMVLLLPTTPGQIGVLEAGAIGALTAFGVELPAATAFALLYHAAHHIPPTAVGAVVLARLDLRKAAAGGGEPPPPER